MLDGLPVVCKAFNVAGIDLVLAQQLIKDLPSTCGFGNEEHGSGAGVDKALQVGCWRGGLGFNAQVRQGVGGKSHLMLCMLAAKHEAPALL